MGGQWSPSRQVQKKYHARLTVVSFLTRLSTWLTPATVGVTWSLAFLLALGPLGHLCAGRQDVGVAVGEADAVLIQVLLQEVPVLSGGEGLLCRVECG